MIKNHNDLNKYITKQAKRILGKQAKLLKKKKKGSNVFGMKLTPILVLFLCGTVHADDIIELVPCIITVESDWRVEAVSNKGGVGLMQITPIVLVEYNTERAKEGYAPYIMEEIFDPAVNVRIGTWYLRRLKDHYLCENYTIERLLHAWNGGITKLRKYNYDCSKMPKESRKFSRKVIGLYYVSKKSQ